MVENKLVAATPSAEMIETGEALLRRLDQVGYPVDAALWLSVPESGLWRLMIASPKVRLTGRRQAYRQLLSHIRKVGNAALSLSNISVIDSSDSLIELLRVAIRTGPGMSGVHFTGNTINGVLFPDAYIYRVL